jgi:hypothetical protein
MDDLDRPVALRQFVEHGRGTVGAAVVGEHDLICTAHTLQDRHETVIERLEAVTLVVDWDDN